MNQAKSFNDIGFVGLNELTFAGAPVGVTANLRQCILLITVLFEFPTKFPGVPATVTEW
jgi:hypothetical protein